MIEADAWTVDFRLRQRTEPQGHGGVVRLLVVARREEGIALPKGHSQHLICHSVALP